MTEQVASMVAAPGELVMLPKLEIVVMWPQIGDVGARFELSWRRTVLQAGDHHKSAEIDVWKNSSCKTTESQI